MEICCWNRNRQNVWCSLSWQGLSRALWDESSWTGDITSHSHPVQQKDEDFSMAWARLLRASCQSRTLQKVSQHKHLIFRNQQPHKNFISVHSLELKEGVSKKSLKRSLSFGSWWKECFLNKNLCFKQKSQIVWNFKAAVKYTRSECCSLRISTVQTNRASGCVLHKKGQNWGLYQSLVLRIIHNSPEVKLLTYE